MKNYVLGFMFNAGLNTVVLLEKRKPDWQKFRLNGVGGKIKRGETAVEAMRREWLEETGVKFDGWKPFCTMRGRDWRVVCFTGWNQEAFDGAHTVTRETVEKVHWRDVYDWQIVPNLQWLVPMARAYFDDGCGQADVQY